MTTYFIQDRRIQLFIRKDYRTLLTPRGLGSSKMGCRTCASFLTEGRRVLQNVRTHVCGSGIQVRDRYGECLLTGDGGWGTGNPTCMIVTLNGRPPSRIPPSTDTPVTSLFDTPSTNSTPHPTPEVHQYKGTRTSER